MSYSVAPEILSPALAPAFLGLTQPMVQPAMQQTLARDVSCAGIGVHSGQHVTMRLRPADADTGITFIRTDLFNGARTIPARWDHVVDTRMCTVIGNAHGGQVATIEHLMAALRACGIDNAVIEINGGEVPVMDGSSRDFVALITQAGITAQTSPRREIEILAPVSVGENGKTASLSPFDAARYSVTITFDRAPINTQSCDVTLSPETFAADIAAARTFGFHEQAEEMRKLGLGLGASLHNAVVIKGDAVMNPEGLRFPDEFARHKTLDAIGDLALAGMHIRGHFHGHCCGHALNNRLLHALFARPDAWRMIDSGRSYPQPAVA